MYFKYYYEKVIEAFCNINSMDNTVIFSKEGKFQSDAIAIGVAAIMLEFYLKIVYKWLK